jgi:hypothetical protein
MKLKKCNFFDEEVVQLWRHNTQYNGTRHNNIQHQNKKKYVTLCTCIIVLGVWNPNCRGRLSIVDLLTQTISD